ncbi:MAG: LacI family DNA-binding transcriptional regulator [Anaerolineaceae bacterium]|nr:LacI family DNA-binding transcriptional regulator [Anaerolineaceae bacterium]
MSVTIKDIAKLAGVSHTTVSRALNGNPAIPEKTRTMIKELAAEMGYLPSATARGLKTHHTQALGVLVSHIDNPYFGEIVQGIEDALKDTGYNIFIASSYQDTRHEKNILQAFGEHRVEGVIIGSVPVHQASYDLLDAYGIPAVVINNQSLRNHRYAVSHDDIYGAREVTRHLLHLGHTKIAYLGNASASRINHNRLRGFKAELSSSSIDPTPELIQHQPGSEIENGVKGITCLLEANTEFSAVFCFNDLMAIGALSVLRARGIAVPGEISVAGFDNIPYSAYTNPPLTTFDQPKREIGAEAARMLLELIHQPVQHNTPFVKMMRGNLLVRESTAPRER